MNPLPKKTKDPLESEIQSDLIKRFVLDEWYCIRTHGNEYQSGFPDIFICSCKFGSRWVEIKRPKKNSKFYDYTDAQIYVFYEFAKRDVGVWTLSGNTDHERAKLFKKSNWHTFLNPSGITLKDATKKINKYGPEGRIQDSILSKLRSDGWFCLETYGSVFQSGLPDIYACHKRFGVRWIECKNPAGYKFTPKQVEVFPHLTAKGVGLWILTDVSQIQDLFSYPNWHRYFYK